MSDFKAKMHQIRFSVGAPSQTPLRELTALPQRGLLLRGGRRKGVGKRGMRREG